ncbi:MAG: SMP-30/gluconolactonase/LRE family protein, partial [Pseudomonadota bacterium]
MARTMLIWLGVLVGCAAPSDAPDSRQSQATTVGEIVVRDPRLRQLVDPAAPIREIVSGRRFTEGPVWMYNDNAAGYLLFSDIPADTVYRWTHGQGLSVLLQPVRAPDASGVGGSNGLMQHPDGRLVLCEHGNRRVAVMDAQGQRHTLADRHAGKRLNSPNDIVFHASGAAFFTDPPYGLEGLEDSAAAEQGVNGIYRLDPDGMVTRLATQTRPNGIGLSPDQRTLYVANSAQPPHRYWLSYPVRDDLGLGPVSMFFDANDLPAAGVPDGLVVARSGAVFATGPGGVLVFDERGEHLGTIA